MHLGLKSLSPVNHETEVDYNLIIMTSPVHGNKLPVTFLARLTDPVLSRPMSPESITGINANAFPWIESTDTGFYEIADRVYHPSASIT
ncbi:hypothetical protein N7491_002330 [Penicillium cf. griseofulvum]|uniref:Uncharacterized protein n=1 Tax=Penicillium cf. griseofulvum TaxID=2972120 RepID=A0A9W9MTB9_9EURO|nr:hypothetical protein N7472_003487 [Penicillium cf. griseofulvum]KAJ5446248.1 hypothetical protein N7491_002330 [Penicillium cf. griseofulvum]KAJ5447991.1 hypothetical protein N7445_002812 [Penicillium cf. griseofulvum]